jgi:hypothetical protein
VRRAATPVLLAVSLAVLGVAASRLIATGPRVPEPASPWAVRITAYNAAGAALTQTIHDRAGLRTLQSDLQHLAPRLAAEVFTCPVDNGSHYRAVFSYANHRDLVADVRRTGCEEIFLSGARAPTLTWSNPQLLADLDDLFPPEWQSGF